MRKHENTANISKRLPETVVRVASLALLPLRLGKDLAIIHLCDLHGNISAGMTRQGGDSIRVTYLLGPSRVIRVLVIANSDEAGEAQRDSPLLHLPNPTH